MNPVNGVQQIPLVSTSPSYSLSLRIRLANRPGTLDGLTTMIGRAGGNIEAIDTVDAFCPEWGLQFPQPVSLAGADSSCTGRARGSSVSQVIDRLVEAVEDAMANPS